MTAGVTALDYFEGSGSGKLETRVSDTTLGVLFENNASINFIIHNTFDRLNSPLRIPSGNPHVTIPTGDYSFVGYTGNFTTNGRRKISGNGAFSWGDFYRGERRQVTAGLNMKPTYHFSLNLTYDRNWVSLLIHHPLSDVYIVYNDTRDTLFDQLRERAFIVKFTNLFNF